jgi:hypothetical protein
VAPDDQPIEDATDDGVHSVDLATARSSAGRAVRATSVVIVGAAIVPAKTCVVHHFMINQFAAPRKNIDIRVN